MAYIQDADVKDATQAGAASRLINAAKIYVSSFSKTLAQAISDGDIGAPPTFLEEALTLSSGDISAGYIDLAVEVQDASIVAHFGRTAAFLSLDFTTSVVLSKTRITFAGEFALSGDNALVDGDVVRFKYLAI